MTKSELVEQLAKSCNISKQAADRYLDHLSRICRYKLKGGEEVTLTGLGKFKVVQQAARTGRNPRDGSPITIPAKKKVKFLPHKALKEAVA